MKQELRETLALLEESRIEKRDLLSKCNSAKEDHTLLQRDFASYKDTTQQMLSLNEQEIRELNSKALMADRQIQSLQDSVERASALNTEQAKASTFLQRPSEKRK